MCELPPEAHGRSFIPPAHFALLPAVPQGPVATVHLFTTAAQRALQEGRPAASACGGDSSSSRSRRRSSSVGPLSLLRLADSVLPTPALQAAASVLASLAAQQLLQPRARSPGALLAVAGGSFGCSLALLACVMHSGLVTLCHASAAAGSLLGAQPHDCAISEGSAHQLALHLVVVAETFGVWLVLAFTVLERQGSRSDATHLLLHMQQLSGPALAFLLLRLLLAALLVAAAVLLLAFTVVLLFSLLAWLPGALTG